MIPNPGPVAWTAVRLRYGQDSLILRILSSLLGWVRVSGVFA